MISGVHNHQKVAQLRLAAEIEQIFDPDPSPAGGPYIGILCIWWIFPDFQELPCGPP